MAECPNLSGLPLLPTAAYPESDSAWDDRHDLVRGGCRVGTPEETSCYDAWSKALVLRMLENPLANTVVLLSVGAGVHELRTLKLMQTMRGNGAPSSMSDVEYRRISQVWLIDPQTTPSEAAQVAAHYAFNLDPDGTNHVDVSYFAGEQAYAEATARVLQQQPLDIGAIGALNYALDYTPPFSTVYEALAFVQLIQETNNDNLHVVQAWWNRRDGYKNPPRDETAKEFVYREGRELDQYRLQRSLITYDEFLANETQRGLNLRG